MQTFFLSNNNNKLTHQYKTKTKTLWNLCAMQTSNFRTISESCKDSHSFCIGQGYKIYQMCEKYRTHRCEKFLVVTNSTSASVHTNGGKYFDDGNHSICEKNKSSVVLLNVMIHISTENSLKKTAKLKPDEHNYCFICLCSFFNYKTINTTLSTTK